MRHDTEVLQPHDTCESCKYLQPTQGAADQGECRRWPPQVTHLMVPVQANVLSKPSVGINGFAGFPIVKFDQWCGEHQLKLLRGVQ